MFHITAGFAVRLNLFIPAKSYMLIQEIIIIQYNTKCYTADFTSEI